jgi:integrase
MEHSTDGNVGIPLQYWNPPRFEFSRNRYKPSRRLMRYEKLAWQHYDEELAADQRLRERPVEMSEEVVIVTDRGRLTVPAVPQTVRRWNEFTRPHREELKRIVAGDALDEEIGANVGWVLDYFQDRGLISVERGSTEWRRLAQMFAHVQLEVWKRRDERDSGEPDGVPVYKHLASPRPADLHAEVVSLRELFTGYIAELRRANRGYEAEKRWKPCIDSLIAFTTHDDARRLTRQDVIGWTNLLREKLAPKTIRDSYLAALKATLKWGVDNARLTVNAAEKATVRVARQTRERERGFTDAEALAILKAAIAHKPATRQNPRTVEGATLTAAKRWVPFLCAFTGARVAEMTQLRREDVRLNDEIPYLRITPEAGSTKTGDYRDVPLHPQLIALGFGEAIKASSDGPLFYDGLSKRRKGSDHASKQVAQRLAKWVREMTVEGAPTIPASIQPNHGWRHRFKTEARRLGISDSVRIPIQSGHRFRFDAGRRSDLKPATIPK